MKPYCTHKDARPANARMCNPCHAAYMRDWRKDHPLNEEQLVKARTRSYTHELIRRGKIKREPCSKCGSEKAEAHHKLYPNPWFIEWLCRPCHLKEHRDKHETISETAA